MQRESEQRPHKISYHVETNEGARVVAELEEAIRGRGLRAQVSFAAHPWLLIIRHGCSALPACCLLLSPFNNSDYTS
jgi:hypothetical protein